MTPDDSGTVTVCERGKEGLYADDHGVTVRYEHLRVRDRSFSWAEIRCFADGATNPEVGDCKWILHIVLHSGRQIRVECTREAPTPETLSAIRRVAERYGIPAEVTGIPMKNGQPADYGLYHDPAGKPGIRYWDGREWSPLLPLDVGLGLIRKSASSWSALPTADGPWTKAAGMARWNTRLMAVFTAVTVVTLTAGLLTELWWDRSAHHRHATGLWWFSAAVFAAALALGSFRWRRYNRKLDQAANQSVSGSR